MKGPRSGDSERGGFLVELVGGKKIIIPRKEKRKKLPSQPCELFQGPVCRFFCGIFIDYLSAVISFSSIFFFFFGLVSNETTKRNNNNQKKKYVNNSKEWEVPGGESELDVG